MQPREGGPGKGLTQEQRERLNRAWEAMENGDPETAGLEAEAMMDESDGNPEVRFLLGAALLESGVTGDALDHLRTCEGQVEDPVFHQFYFASALFENLHVDEALAVFREVIRAEPQFAPPRHGLAQCLEFQGEYEQAEKQYERAYQLDQEGYPLPVRMKRSSFHDVVEEAAEHLPPDLRVHLQRISVVIEDLPSLEILRTEGGDDPITPVVLGLYVGPSLRDRSVYEPVTTPPAIFLYQRNLERICQTREELINEIRLTLYHELGHYLGYSDEDLEERGLD